VLRLQKETNLAVKTKTNGEMDCILRDGGNRPGRRIVTTKLLRRVEIFSMRAEKKRAETPSTGRGGKWNKIAKRIQNLSRWAKDALRKGDVTCSGGLSGQLAPNGASPNKATRPSVRLKPQGERTRANRGT